LTTTSTVVAVATGMFTLRDEIFSQQGGNAQASVAMYEQSVGEICDVLNRADRARARNARRLAKRLRSARTTTAQRNALLDSTNEVIASSEHGRARLAGLDAPGQLLTRHRDAVAAWDRVLARERGYAQRLDAVTSRRGLLWTVATLPAMRTVLANDLDKREGGLKMLGGARCQLNTRVVTPTITLPGTRWSVTPPAALSSRSSTRRPGPSIAPMAPLVRQSVTTSTPELGPNVGALPEDRLSTRLP
jgi:hypothetical protein